MFRPPILQRPSSPPPRHLWQFLRSCKALGHVQRRAKALRPAEKIFGHNFFFFNVCFANLFFVPHNCSALIEENHLEKIFWKYETKDSMDDRDNGFSPNLGQIPSFVNIFVNFSDHGNVVTAKDVKTKHDLKQTCF